MSRLLPGTVVATLLLPLPVNEGMLAATKGLEAMYGESLVILPTVRGTDFVKVAVA